MFDEQIILLGYRKNRCYFLIHCHFITIEGPKFVSQQRKSGWKKKILRNINTGRYIYFIKLGKERTD